MNVPSLKSIFVQENNQWCDLTLFVNLLKKNSKEHDKLKDFKNIKRDLKSDSKIVDDKTFVSLKGIIRYCYNHENSLHISKQIVHEVNIILSKSKGKEPIKLVDNSSCLDLYEEISKKSFKNVAIEDIFFNNIELPEDKILYLYHEYKPLFLEKEWKRICLFEYHFHLYNNVNLEYEELTQQKWKIWKKLLHFTVSVDDVARQSKQTIQMKTERKELASDYETIRFWIDNKFHLANKIEQDICQQGIDLNIEHIFENIACFDCTRKCSHGEGIHVIVELPDMIEDFNLHDISLLMKSTIKNKHSIQCWSVIFCRPTSLTRYKNSKGSFNRFILRDDYINSRIHHHIVFTHIHQQEDNEIERIVENCPSCETKTDIEPLDWKCFNNLKEWQLSVPLHMQILFETFINSNSIKKSKDLKALVEQKISCMYSLYDTLLNVFNRTYIGVLQIRNTEELLLNYRNIQTVFDITSDTGTTLSLKEAERQLKEKADPDLCYYNTYLKRHSFPYVTIDEQSKSRLCLRECVLVLMLDNLVRLRFHSDPDRGENRSQQICTLPVTIKGLPHDSNVTREWHDDMCDLVDNCNCRKRCNINKTDGLNSLTVLTEEESSDIKKFCQLIQWSIVECWETIKIEPYIKTLLTKVQPSIETEKEEHSEGNEDTIDYDFLDVSMASLQINESQILETSLQSLGAAFSELDVSIESVEDDLFEIKLQSFEEENPDNSTKIEDRTGIEEDITDLTRAILNAELPFDPESFILEADKRDIEDLHSVFHDESDNNDRDNSENNSEKIYPTLIEALNFKAYDAPSLLCRHPPPYTGRDDDESKLREILDDILIKSDQQQTYKDGQNRILFAPDHKIGKNLISLMKKCSKYQIFLPEFPILHLRKSRICNICSGYKNAGLVHLLKYMRDDNTDEWSKLLSERCIDDATTVIWRLSLSLHLSFFLQFIMQLPSQKLKEIMKDMDDKNYNNLLSFWDNQLGDFIEHCTNRNATFTLHKEMMNHCDEVLAIAFSERLGGCKGYSLLLAAIKSSLPFAFLNGASSYAAYTTHLLHEHYTAGMYHQKLKMALYSTPHRTGTVTVNFGLDSQREMDHRDVVKGFRSGSSIKSIIPRMSIIDELGQAHLKRKHIESKLRQKLPFSVIKNTDLKHVIPTAELILRRNGLETDVNIIPYNVYAKKILCCLLLSWTLQHQTLEGI